MLKNNRVVTPVYYVINSNRAFHQIMENRIIFIEKDI